jgi:hypothetical protein
VLSYSVPAVAKVSYDSVAAMRCSPAWASRLQSVRPVGWVAELASLAPASKMHTCVLVADGGNIYELLHRFASYGDSEKKPDAKWDFFGIGGRFEGAIPLKEPRTLRRFFGLLPAGQTTRVSVAKKSEVDQEAFLANPPAALFFRDQLYESPFFAEREALAKWREEFRRRFAQIPDDTTLQIVDAHG